MIPVVKTIDEVRKQVKEWLVQFFGIDFIYFALLTEF